MGVEGFVRIGVACDDRGNAVAMCLPPQRGDRIGGARAIGGVQRGALGADDGGDRLAERVLGEGVPDRRGHAKSSAWKAVTKAAASVSGVSGSRRGRRTRSFTLPIADRKSTRLKSSQ